VHSFHERKHPYISRGMEVRVKFGRRWISLVVLNLIALVDTAGSCVAYFVNERATETLVEVRHEMRTKTSASESRVRSP